MAVYEKNKIISDMFNKSNTLQTQVNLLQSQAV